MEHHLQLPAPVVKIIRHRQIERLNSTDLGKFDWTQHEYHSIWNTKIHMVNLNLKVSWSQSFRPTLTLSLSDMLFTSFILLRLLFTSFLTRKSCGGRLAIGAAAARQFLIVCNAISVSKKCCGIICFNAGLKGRSYETQSLNFFIKVHNMYFVCKYRLSNCQKLTLTRKFIINLI